MEGYDYNKISRPHYLTLKNLFCSMEKSSVNKYTLLTLHNFGLWRWFLYTISEAAVCLPPPPHTKNKS